MVKRRMAVIVIMLFFCFGLMSSYVLAASTTDASRPIDVDKECTLTLTYICNEIAFENVPVKLYRIADVSNDFQFTLTPNFSKLGIVLNGMKSDSEWNVIRSTLEAYILAEKIEVDSVRNTDVEGKVSFTNLKPGLYLAMAEDVMREEWTYFFDSALVTMPGLTANGNWEYEITVATKATMIPPIESDEEIELKVVKLWKGDQGTNCRPKSIEVEIFRDGELYEKIVLSKENQWSYRWSAKDDGVKWTVIEKKVPYEYMMTVEERETSFVITNTYVPEHYEEEPKEPQTGDTANVMLYIIFMIVSGSILMTLGYIGGRKVHEKSK